MEIILKNEFGEETWMWLRLDTWYCSTLKGFYCEFKISREAFGKTLSCQDKICEWVV